MPELKPIFVDYIICDDIRQEIGDKISLIGVYTTKISVPKINFRFAKLCFLIKMKGGEGEFGVKVALVGPSQNIASIDFPGKLKLDNKLGSALISVFEGLEIKEVGKYRLETFLNDETTPSFTVEFMVEIKPISSAIIQ